MSCGAVLRALPVVTEDRESICKVRAVRVALVLHELGRKDQRHQECPTENVVDSAQSHSVPWSWTTIPSINP